MHSRESQKSDKNNRKLFEIINYSVACLESAQITWHWTKQMIRIIRHAHYTEDERMKQKTSLQRPVYLFSTQLMSGSASGGSGIPVYPKKIRQNTPKYPKFIQIYPKLYPGTLYTWNSKKVIYRIPAFKLQYTVYPKKHPVYRIPKNPGRPCDVKWCQVYMSNLFQTYFSFFFFSFFFLEFLTTLLQLGLCCHW